MREYELTTKYDSRASFYGKARVTETIRNSNTGNHNTLVLTSYTTDVATIVDGKAKVFGTYSQTTLRHIKEFLLQNGFKAENSKQIMADYGPKKAVGSN